MKFPADLTVVKKLKKTSKIMGYSAILIGSLVLIGWIFHVAILKTVLPNGASMKPVTAISFIIFGLNIVTYEISSSEPNIRLLKRVLKVAIGLVIIASSLDIVAYLSGGEINIADRLLAGGKNDSNQGYQQMCFGATVCFLLLSITFFMLPLDRSIVLRDGILSFVICFSLIGLLSYAFWSNDATGLFGFRRMALHSSIAFLCISFGMLLLHPDRGWLAIASSDTLGGKLVRRLLIQLIVMLLILIEIRYAAQQFGYISSDFGVIISSIIGIILICYSVLRAANELAREDIRRKAAEQKTLELNKRLEARTNQLEIANNELQQMVYVTSHDLQEPLKTISNYSGLLYKKYKDSLDSKANIYLDFLNAATNRMRTLIHDILSYGNACNTEEFAEYDCNEILKRALFNLRTAISESKAIIENSSLPTIYCHKDLLQVFLHLIDNAMKYHKNGESPKIVIDCHSQGDKWLFSIADNGIGISRKYFHKIFKLFQKLHAKHEYEGAGIGLAICKKIVECHNGEIWVESEEGSGSTFFFTISKTLKDEK